MRSNDSSGSARVWLLSALGFLGVAGLTVLLLALLTNIFERKQEARQPFVRVVEVTEDDDRPEGVGQELARRVRQLSKTALPTTTKYGGRGPGASDAGPAEQKLDRDPGSSACSRATPSRSTTATAAATPTCSSTRSRPSA